MDKNDYNNIMGRKHKTNVLKVLQEKLSYIYDSFIVEGYELPFKECDIFKKIEIDNNAVGFITYNLITESNLILTFIYILPEYRRKGLFFKIIEEEYKLGNTISIHQPTRNIVDCLIRYGFANKITDSIVISAINFNIDTKTPATNKKLNNNGKYLLTNLYDLNLATPLSLKIFNKNKYDLTYSHFLKDNKGIEKSEEIEDNYFDKIVGTLIDRDMEIERRLILLKYNLPSEEFNDEEIIGNDSELSNLLLEYHFKGKITEKQAIKIKNQLLLEYKMGNITNESIVTRLDYLIYRLNHDMEALDKLAVNPCPYCNEELDFTEKYCLTCGYNTSKLLDLTNPNKFIYYDVLVEKTSYKHSLTGIKEKTGNFDEDYLKNIAILTTIQELNNGNTKKSLFKNMAKSFNQNEIYFKEMMIDEGVITYGMNSEKWDIESNQYKLSELKAILKRYNLKTSGNKSDLIKRIKEEVPLNNIKSQTPAITQKASSYLKENSAYLFHNEYLPDYVFSEYAEYVIQNRTSEGIDNIDFLEKHIEVGIKTKNHKQVTDSLYAQSYLFSQAHDYEQSLYCLLRIFLINLNMIYIDSEYYAYYYPVDKATINEIKEKLHYVDSSIVENSLHEIYNSLDEDEVKISFKECLHTLVRSLNYSNIKNLNQQILNQVYLKPKNIQKINSYKRVKNDKTKKTTLDKFFTN